MTKVEISRFDHQARGIAYLDNKITFIENALPGEVVDIDIIKMKKNYNIGQIKQYEKISLDREKPFCPFYESCGGCHLEHLNYENTLKFKKEKIQNIFSHNNIEIPEITLIKNEHPKNYRNKLSLKIVNSHIGFYQEKTHDLIEISSCAIASPAINIFLKQLSKLNIKNGKITIRSNYNNELLIILETKNIINFNPDDFKNSKIVGVILNNKTIYGNNFFYERMNNCLFKVTYDAFFQVNPFITKELFNILEENISTNHKVLDLYSGVGTLGIIASKKASKVYSIEIVKNAVLDNLENKKLNKRDNIEVFLGNASKVLNKINPEFDTIIIDPPRKGLAKNSLEIILNSKAKKIIYISCDPITLVRDLKILLTKYKVEKYYLLDMFSYTYHVESVCILNLR